MKGKFVAPAGAGTPNAKGIYIAGSTALGVVQGVGASVFTGLGILNSDLSLDNTASVNNFLTGGSGTNIFVAKQFSNGNILFAGDFQVFGGVDALRAILLDSNGNRISFPSFVSFNNIVTDVQIQSDGKIILVGYFTLFTSNSVNRIIRLNSDYSRDTSFVIGTGFNDVVNKIKIQSDGKIIAVGNFTSYNGTVVNRVVRLNTDGSIDSSFNIGTGANGTINDVDIDPVDGKVYIGGSYTSFNGNTSSSIIRFTRLNTNGSIDLPFGVNNFNGSITNIKVMSNRDVITAGSFTFTSPVRAIGICRLTVSGAFSSNFKAFPAMYNTVARVYDIIEISGGKIILTGAFGMYDTVFSPKLVELNSDGTVSRSVNFELSNGTSVTGYLRGALLLSSGKFLIYGTQSLISNIGNAMSSIGVLKIKEDGLYDDLNFRFSVATPNATSVPILINGNSNGDIFITSSATNQYGRPVSKLDSFGRLVYGFSKYQSRMDGNISGLKIDEQTQSFFMGGDMRAYDGIITQFLIKLDFDGNLDIPFNNNYMITPANSNVTTIECQQDGKILLGGGFGALGGFGRGRIARLNADGSLDTTAFNHVGFNAAVNGIVLSPDGKIYARGSFTNYITVNSAIGLARLNSDGSFDSSFNVGTGVSSVQAMAVQPDGKLIIVGNFITYNSILINRIARLNLNGSIDSSFNVGTGFNATVRDIKIKSDGTIHVVGDFVNYNGNRCSGYCILDQNGGFINPNLFLSRENTSGNITSLYIKE